MSNPAPKYYIERLRYHGGLGGTQDIVGPFDTLDAATDYPSDDHYHWIRLLKVENNIIYNVGSWKDGVWGIGDKNAPIATVDPYPASEIGGAE